MSSKLLIELIEAMGRTNIIEGYVNTDGEGWMTEGLQWGNSILINPVPNMVHLILHEMLHAIRPDWSESSVRQHATKLLRSLTDDEKVAIYNLYEARKVVRKSRLSGD